MSGARPALWTDSREHRDTWSRQIAPAPPNRHNRFSGITLNRPLGSLRPGLHGLPALSGVLAPPCVTVRPGMSAFSRNLYFWTGRTNPPSAQIRGRGPELPLNRHGHVIERLLGLDAIAPSPGVWIARRWPILPPGGAPPAHAWGPTSPYGLLFCMSQSHAIRAKGYLFVRAYSPCRRGTAYVSRPKKGARGRSREPHFI